MDYSTRHSVRFDSWRSTTIRLEDLRMYIQNCTVREQRREKIEG